MSLPEIKESQLPPPSPTARYTLVQAIAEVSLGSVIHAIHLPLGGHFLSLNQALILTFASRSAADRREAMSTVTGVGTSAAILKALSPAGKRLTPMLAIGVQSVLFALGIGALGRHVLGAVLGGVLLSIWGFAQPLLLGYLLFGNVLFEAALKIWTDTALALGISTELGLRFLLGLVIAKAAIAGVLTAAAWLSGERLEKAYLRRVKKLAGQTKPLPSRKVRRTAISGALRDLLNPWFVASVILTILFFVMSGPDGATHAVWFTLRTLAWALLFFWAIRAVPRRWIHLGLKKFPRVAAGVQYALGELKR